MSMTPPPPPPSSPSAPAGPPTTWPPNPNSEVTPTGQPTLGSASSGFIDTVAAEWIKMRTVRSFWFMLGLAVAFPIVITLLTAAFGSYPFSDDDFVDTIAGLCVLTAMILGAFAVTTLTSEYGYQTIRVTYTATPNRLRVHLAKLLTVVVLTAAAQFVAYVVCWVIAKIANAEVASLTSSLVLTSLVYTVVLGPLVVVFGYALGLNLRNSAAAISLLLLWPFLIETIVAGLLFVVGAESGYRWLPFNSLLSATTSVAYPDSSDGLGRPWAQIWFLAVAGGLWALGMYREANRDA